MLLLLLFCCFAHAERKQSPNVAIVGGGIAGLSSAYYMRELFPNCNITVYEKDKIGGRLATITLAEKQYEMGGSIIHSDNKYMANFRKILGLKIHQSNPDKRTAFYDGDDVIFETSTWSPVTLVKLLWRYGKDIWRLQSSIKNLLIHFNNIYKEQDEGYSFTTPEKLLEVMATNTSHMLYQSIRQALKSKGFGDKIVEELVMAALRTNYGQTTDIQSFVGHVGVAGVDGNLWSIHGGNKLVPERLVEKTGAKVVKGKVYQVFYDEDAHGETFYTVDADDGSHMDPIQTTHDLVIFAVPFIEGDRDPILFHNFPRPVYNRFGDFQRTVATFVKGTPNYKKFGYKSLSDFPSSILTTKEKTFFNSIGRQTPVDYSRGENDSSVWKVFSPKLLTEEQLNELFLQREETKFVDWQAYPKYKSNEDSIPPFVVFNRMYYVNAIEWAASAMELSVIGARNAALLAYNEWKGRLNKIDQHSRYAYKKVEL